MGICCAVVMIIPRVLDPFRTHPVEHVQKVISSDLNAIGIGGIWINAIKNSIPFDEYRRRVNTPVRANELR